MLQNVTILCEPLKRIGLQKMKSKNTQKRSENAKICEFLKKHPKTG